MTTGVAGNTHPGPKIYTSCIKGNSQTGSKVHVVKYEKQGTKIQ